MKGITHLLAGILVGLVLSSFSLFFSEKLLIFSLAVVGSLLPDIDTSSSLGGRRVKIIGYLFTHRGIFHSLPFFILLSVVFAELFSFLAGIALFCGLFSHFILDSITKEGLYLFFLHKRVRGPFRVGASVEKGLRVLLVLLIILVFI